ncbi:hypothetical protein RN001_012540 [Aquatica leii]|uniref:Nose resistant-to-fluoxetine protein N-terminal domain-containing protein n=1 Tax=Aquatica leii TaxID=1421715 RepID=A0AAN7SMH7_9COLE|nr:hypothetical protein RN001_012540 [Aquatica leii]
MTGTDVLTDSVLNEVTNNYVNNFNISSECHDDIVLVLNGLKRKKLWAWKMFDALPKIPSGILEGNINDLGTFDECIAINEKVGSNNILGKYCLVNIALNESLFLRVSTSIIFSSKDNSRRLFFGFVLFVIVISTTYDIIVENVYKGKTNVLLSAFSVVKNTKKIFTITKDTNQIPCVYGIRVISMMWIVIGHIYVIRRFYPGKNIIYLSNAMLNHEYDYIFAATKAVDTFLLLTGLTLSYVFLSSANTFKFNLLVFYLHRFLRLTPALGAVVLTYIGLLKYLSSGPYWPSISVQESEICKKQWWKTIFYINIYDNNICLSQTWYLAVDTQLYIISPIILLGLQKKPKIAIYLVGFLTICVMGISFAISWIYNMDSNFIFSTNFEYATRFYTKTYTRAAPWLIGVIVGYIIYITKQKDPKIKINLYIVFFLWLISITTMVLCGFYELETRKQDFSTKLQNSLYNAFVHVAWSISVGWIIFACTFGYGEIQKLSNPNSFAKHLVSLVQKNETRFISLKCLQHLLEYATSLLNLEIWAFKMFDASEKLPAGLFQGNGGGLGDFDECIGLKQNTSVGTIKGKYCLGHLQIFDFKKYAAKIKLIDFGDLEVTLPWGICLPDSCSVEDFRYVTLTIFQYSQRFCQTLESQTTELDIGDYTAIAILGVIGLISTISTVLYITFKYKKKRAMGTHYFSILAGIESITNNEIKESDITCLYGLRSITLFFLIAALKFIMYPLSVLTNWVALLEWITNRYYLMILESAVSVDTFFVISGMLVSYKYLFYKQKGARFNIVLYYLNRIMRLTPALAVTVLVSATLMRHYGSGPIWPYIRNLFIVDSCRKHWWSSLLYVQNYVNPGFTDICILQTWFLSVDMQLIILSPLLLIPLGKVPKYTVGFTMFLLICSIVSPFIATWVYDLKAILVNNINPVELDNYMKHFYFPLHTHASSWIIGFLLGYFLHESKKDSNRQLIKNIFSPAVVLFFWTVSIGLFILCVVISQAYLEKEYNWLTNAFHFALIRPAWSLAVSWIIFACVNGYSGPVNAILSASMFRVLSKLSYSIFLVNFSILIILTHQIRKGLTFSVFNVLSVMWGDIVWSFVFGFLLAIFVERPFIMIFKSICKKYGKRIEETEVKANLKI